MSRPLQGISVQDVRSAYNSLYSDPPQNDEWHEHSQLEREGFIRDHFVDKITSESRLLNVGSGGDSLNLHSQFHVHVDIAEKSLRKIPHSIAADVQNLPFRSSTYDLAVCTGCVLNYCDAASAVVEISRVLKPGGIVLLEFERSQTFEYLLTGTFSRDVALVETFYNGTQQTMWVYSEEYIRSLLSITGFTLLRRHAFHILSPLVLRYTKSVVLAGRSAWADKFVRHVPSLDKLACNVILLCEKRPTFS
jgi:SAM-dependent methyltransferase